MEKESNNLKKMKPKKRFYFIILVLICSFLFQVSFLGIPKKAEAFPSEDVTLWAWEFWKATKDETERVKEGIWDALKAGSALAFKNAIKVFMGRLAQTTAKWIASGGESQSPLVYFQSWDSFVANAGDAMLGDFLQTLATENGLVDFDLCSPDASFNINLGWGMIDAVEPREPECTFSQMQKAWEEKINDPAFLEQFAVSWGPTQDPLGVSVGAEAELYKKISDKEREQILERAGGRPFADVTSGPSKYIETPGDVVAQQWQKSVEKTDTAETTFTGEIIADAVNVFATTLLSELMSKLQGGMWSLADLLGEEQERLGENIFNWTGSGSISPSAAENNYAEFITPALGYGGRLPLLDTLVACPDEDDRTYLNCVIDDKFRVAIEQQMTVKEAIENLKISTNLPFSIGEEGTILELPGDGYSYRSISILRRYRIVPAGWQIAADYIRDFASGNYDIGLLLDAYDNCYKSDYSPFCGLVDPDWVLKSPENICRKMGYSEDIADERFIDDGNPYTTNKRFTVRHETCVDDHSCLIENDDGECGAYGYCYKDKRIYRFDGEQCEPQNYSCMTFKDKDKKSFSYLMNNLNFSDCDASNAGCEWYCRYHDDSGNFACFGPGDKDPVTNKNKTINFDRDARICDSEDAGCTNFIRQANSNANLIANPSFDYIKKDFDLDEWDNTAQTGGGWDSGTFPSTDTGFKGWTINGPTVQILPETEIYHSAPVAVKISGTDNNSNHMNYKIETNQPLLNRTFLISFWASAKDTTGSCANPCTRGVHVGINHGNGTQDWLPGGLDAYSEHGNWKYYTGDIYTFDLNKMTDPYDTSFPFFIKVPRYGNAEVIIDDIKVEEITPPMLALASSFSGYNAQADRLYFNDQKIRCNYSEADLEKNIGVCVSSVCKGGVLHDSACTTDDDCINNFGYIGVDFINEKNNVGCELFTQQGKDATYAIPAKITNVNSSECKYCENDHNVACSWNKDCGGGNKCIPALEKTSCNQCPESKSGCDFYEETAIASGPLNIETDWRTGKYCIDDPSKSCSEDADCGGTNTCQILTSFIPSTGTKCKAENVNCEEYTNLDQAAAGGEAKEYYTQIKQCVKTDDPNTSYFYTWEGDDVTGYQLKSYNLKKSNITYGVEGAPGPCTNLYQPYESYTAAEELICEDTTTNIALCDETIAQEDPNCRQFLDAFGRIFYRYKSRTITVSDDCHPMRNTIDNFVYYAIPAESISCPASEVYCREYKGNAGYNLREIINEDFESGYTNWTGASVTIVSESPQVGGKSMRLEGEAGMLGTKAKYPGIYDQISKDVAYVVEFWAKGNDPISARFFSEEAFSENPSDPLIEFGTTPALSNEEWNFYTIGPVLFNRDPREDEEFQLYIQNNTSKLVFIDNIVLRESEDFYLIKDSFETCKDYEGCRHYKDRGGVSHYLQSFIRLCERDMVGCEAMMNTYNSTTTPYAPWAEDFQKENVIPYNAREDDVYVPADEVEFFVNNPDHKCNASNKGCETLGKPIIDQQSGGISYFEAKYLINDPDTYDTILCQFHHLECKEYKASNGQTHYFKDPGTRICEYGSITPENEGDPDFGWSKKTEGDMQYVNFRCPVRDNTDIYTQPAGSICMGGVHSFQSCNYDSECENYNIEGKCNNGAGTTVCKGDRDCINVGVPTHCKDAGGNRVEHGYCASKIPYSPEFGQVRGLCLPADLSSDPGGSYTFTMPLCEENDDCTGTSTTEECVIMVPGEAQYADCPAGRTCMTPEFFQEQVCQWNGTPAPLHNELDDICSSQYYNQQEQGGWVGQCSEDQSGCKQYLDPVWQNKLQNASFETDVLTEYDIDNNGVITARVDPTEEGADKFPDKWNAGSLAGGDPINVDASLDSTYTREGLYSLKIDNGIILSPNNPISVSEADGKDVFNIGMWLKPSADAEIMVITSITIGYYNDNGNKTYKTLSLETDDNAFTTLDATDDGWVLYNATFGPLEKVQTHKGIFEFNVLYAIIVDSGTSVWLDEPFIYHNHEYYYLEDSVDQQTCTAVDPGQGCVAFRDSYNKTLQYSHSGGVCDSCEINHRDDTQDCRGKPKSCDTNVILKVREDRECEEWLEGDNCTQADESGLEDRDMRVCYELVGCDQLSPSGVCSSSIPEKVPEDINPNIFTSTNTNTDELALIQNLAGYTRIGLDWGGTDRKVSLGLSPIQDMYELGEGAASVRRDIVPNGNLEDFYCKIGGNQAERSACVIDDECRTEVGEVAGSDPPETDNCGKHGGPECCTSRTQTSWSTWRGLADEGDLEDDYTKSGGDEAQFGYVNYEPGYASESTTDGGSEEPLDLNNVIYFKSGNSSADTGVAVRVSQIAFGMNYTLTFKAKFDEASVNTNQDGIKVGLAFYDMDGKYRGMQYISLSCDGGDYNDKLCLPDVVNRVGVVGDPTCPPSNDCGGSSLGTIPLTTNWQTFILGPIEIDFAEATDPDQTRLFFSTDSEMKTKVLLDDISFKPTLRVADYGNTGIYPTDTKYNDEQLTLNQRMLADGFQSRPFVSVARTCRSYPDADSMLCNYTDNSGRIFQGWKGYCLESDPNNPRQCLMWYPVDALMGESSLFDKEPAGYQGRTPLYYCLLAQGVYPYFRGELEDMNTGGVGLRADEESRGCQACSGSCAYIFNKPGLFGACENPHHGCVNEFGNFISPESFNQWDASNAPNYNHLTDEHLMIPYSNQSPYIPELYMYNLESVYVDLVDYKGETPVSNMYINDKAQCWKGVIGSGNNEVNACGIYHEDGSIFNWQTMYDHLISSVSLPARLMEEIPTDLRDDMEYFWYLNDKNGGNCDDCDPDVAIGLIFGRKAFGDPINETRHKVFLGFVWSIDMNKDGCKGTEHATYDIYMQLKDHCAHIVQVVDEEGNNYAWAERIMNENTGFEVQSAYTHAGGWSEKLGYTYGNDLEPFGSFLPPGSKEYDPPTEWDIGEGIYDGDNVPIYPVQKDDYMASEKNNSKENEIYPSSNYNLRATKPYGCRSSCGYEFGSTGSPTASCSGQTGRIGDFCPTDKYCDDIYIGDCFYDGGDCITSETNSQCVGFGSQLGKIVGNEFEKICENSGYAPYASRTKCAASAAVERLKLLFAKPIDLWYWDSSSGQYHLGTQEKWIKGTYDGLPDPQGTGYTRMPFCGTSRSAYEYCGFKPKVENAVINDSNDVAVVDSGSAVTISFRSWVDPEQMPLRDIIIDFGDLTPDLREGWNAKTKEKHIYSHRYTCLAGIDTPPHGSGCFYQPRIQISDNWNFVSGSGSGCSDTGRGNNRNITHDDQPVIIDLDDCSTKTINRVFVREQP